MARLQDAGRIRIGVKYDVPPFGFKNPQSGDVEGFDVDLGKFIAGKLGVEAELVEAISDNRIPFIQDGTVDAGDHGDVGERAAEPLHRHATGDELPRAELNGAAVRWRHRRGRLPGLNRRWHRRGTARAALGTVGI